MTGALVDFAPPPELPHARRWTQREHGHGAVSDRVCAVALRRPGRPWLAALGLSLSLVLVLAIAAWWLLVHGVGIWGVNIPVAWGFAIINFVWWIGIGHAGTLISAILLLLRQGWRTAINRFAEAMTLFAVAMAGLFPLLHLGRPEVFYYLIPYPSSLGVWPQWRSPLVWDLFAIATYGTVSLLFWYLGLIPDLATLRDTAVRPWQRRLAGVFAVGWRGSARHWQRHQKLYVVLAGLATPLVLSVHSIVSLDFSVGLVPGWHSTIFPPYFVAGAIFSGFAMVLTLMIPVRAYYGLGDLISERHLDSMAKVMLVSGLVVALGYCFEFFTAWYSGEPYERAHLEHMFTGAYWPATAVMLLCNVGVPQLLWLRAFRVRTGLLFAVSILINVGMWTERYVIVVTPLAGDFVPAAWGPYDATVWDWLLYLGTLGTFVALMLLFIKLVPMIAIYEVREQHHDEWGQAGDEAERVLSEASERGQARIGSTGSGSGDAGAIYEVRERHHDEWEVAPGAAGGKAGRAPSEAGERGGASDGSAGSGRGEAEPRRRLPEARLFGLSGEFDAPEAAVEAARRLRGEGLRVEAYTPFPVPELAEALGHRTRIAAAVLAGAAAGCLGIWSLMYYTSVVDYAWNIGGRPANSLPSYVPLLFELSVLGGAVAGMGAFFVRCGFPRPYHPIMNATGFERVARDRFLLCVERQGEGFDRARVRGLLRSCGAQNVEEVPC